MKIHLEKAIFVNRAPFDKLELNFCENEIAVFSSANGRGKTTILSHAKEYWGQPLKVESLPSRFMIRPWGNLRGQVWLSDIRMF